MVTENGWCKGRSIGVKDTSSYDIRLDTTSQLRRGYQSASDDGLSAAVNASEDGVR